MELRAWLTPDSPDFRVATRAIWQSRPDLQQAYPDPDSEGFDRWVAVSGLLEYPEQIGAHYPPVPPREIRQTGCGGPEAHGHLYSGLGDFEVVADVYETFAQRPIHEIGAVLDFGSGCGRLLRWFDRAAPRAELTGIDVRCAGVEWSREHLRGDFSVGPFDPPTELPSATFDLVVGLSLFSHFTHAANVAWLRELARVCKPDGIMVLTTHGAFSLHVIANSPEHQQSFGMSAERARALLRELHSSTFHFYDPSPAWRAALEVGDNYGQAFLNEAFVAREWSPFVDVLGCIPARLFHFQDVFVVRPRRPR